ncbi:DUF1700 domain-containing protein [Gemella morbillorum]|jgi:hypothetical protein|uniref:DUF1700 domain-containing protein n=1 Tax=Gemella morbillorum TaxID=29391 RepID=UPI0023F4939C|nr:DUF1700 domain-containing protein [Gemella morbillorum]
MDKKQFCTFLENELRLYLSSKEVYKTLNFFKEIIDDRVDEGLSEEEAVSQLGNIDDIVGQILDEHNIKKRQKKLVWRFIPQKTPSAANIIIAILLFPIWITIFSLVASFFLVFISLIFSLVVSVIAFFVGGIALILKAPFYLIYEKNIAYCLDTLGFGFIITGIGLIGIYYLLKSLKKVRKNSWSFKKMFVKVFKKEVYINE